MGLEQDTDEGVHNLDDAIREEAEETDAYYHIPSRSVVKKEADEYTHSAEDLYKEFCRNLNKEVDKAYDKVFHTAQIQEPDAVKAFIRKVIQDIDGRHYKHMFGVEEQLEIRVQQYIARNTLPDLEALSKDEFNDYKTSLAVLKFKKAFRDKERKNALLFEAYDELMEINESELANNVSRMFDAVEEFYRS